MPRDCSQLHLVKLGCRGRRASLPPRAVLRFADGLPADRIAGTRRRRQCCFSMGALASLLLAIDFLLAIILLDVEMNDPRIKLERVEARREAIRRRDSERRRRR